MTRNQRRKRAATKLKQRIERKAIACRAQEVSAIVRSNLSQPIVRNYYAGIKSSVVLCEERGARIATSNISRPLAMNDREQARFNAKHA